MTDYLPKNSTVTGAYYANELRKLLEELKSKRRGKFFRCMIMRLPTPPLLRRLLRLNVATNYYFIHHICRI